MIPPPAKETLLTETDDIQPTATARRNSVEMADTSEWSGDKRLLLGEEEEEEDDGNTEAMDYAQRSNLPLPVNGIEGNVPNVKTDDTGEDPVTISPQDKKPPCTAYMTVMVLFCVNLLNYSDRYTIAGLATKSS